MSLKSNNNSSSLELDEQFHPLGPGGEYNLHHDPLGPDGEYNPLFKLEKIYDKINQEELRKLNLESKIQNTSLRQKSINFYLVINLIILITLFLILIYFILIKPNNLFSSGLLLILTIIIVYAISKYYYEHYYNVNKII